MKLMWILSTLIWTLDISLSLSGADAVPRHVGITPDRPSYLVLDAVDSILMILHSIPTNTTHLMIQCHSQWEHLTLSQTQPLQSDNVLTGRHVALVMLLADGQSSASWQLDVNSTRNASVDVIVVVTLLGQYDAIPGGCNLELPLKNDPNIYAPYHDSQVHVQYAFPNVGPLKRGSVQRCGDPTYMKMLKMELYMMWLPERDHSWHTYTDSILKMLSVHSIVKHGTKISEVYSHHSMTQQRFAGYVGQGVVYTVVVYTTGAQGERVSAVAQPPVLTYACPSDGCHSIDAGLVVVSVVVGVLGLVLCFFGHRHFSYQVFLGAALVIHFAAFILLSRLTDLSDINCVYVGVAPAVVGGALWLWVWLWLGMPIISVLSSALLSGLIFSSVLFNLTPLGGLEWWTTSLNFSVAFLCGVLVAVVLLVANQRAMSVVSCGVVGSYLAVLAVDVMIRGSIKEVLFNTIRRSTQPQFISAKLLLPFQFSDIILCVVWAGLAVAGITFQFIREKNRPDFPPHPWLKVRREKRNVAPSSPINQRFGGTAERRPLLSQSPVNTYTNEPVNINADILEQNTVSPTVA